VIDGVRVIDVHQHVVRVPTLKMPWEVWAPPGVSGIVYEELHAEDGSVDPAAYHAHLEDEGVDVALLMSEYSPRVTGIQPIEDMLPLVAHDPGRVGVIAALNPHYHFPLVDELERQLELGAVAVKVHPVHGGFRPDRSDLYPVYHVCQERGLPVVVHCGTSTFPGASNRYADPAMLADVIRDFPRLKLVLAHGGRGWSYDVAAFFALAHDNVWIEISGLPPQRLPRYYATVGLARIAPRFIFGTDWPAIPGLRSNVKRLMDLDLDRAAVGGVVWRNAVEG
jgi:uncharacterized protein